MRNRVGTRHHTPWHSTTTHEHFSYDKQHTHPAAILQAECNTTSQQAHDTVIQSKSNAAITRTNGVINAHSCPQIIHSSVRTRMHNILSACSYYNTSRRHTTINTHSSSVTCNTGNHTSSKPSQQLALTLASPKRLSTPGWARSADSSSTATPCASSHAQQVSASSCAQANLPVIKPQQSNPAAMKAQITQPWLSTSTQLRHSSLQ
jgi:hypothetical protein